MQNRERTHARFSSAVIGLVAICGCALLSIGCQQRPPINNEVEATSDSGAGSTDITANLEELRGRVDDLESKVAELDRKAAEAQDEAEQAGRLAQEAQDDAEDACKPYESRFGCGSQ
jgi:methyl-accepting chemotaxis protein